jgi:hypothetical protein
VVRDNGGTILKETFLKYFRGECQNAVGAKGRVVLITSAYSDFDTRGLIISNSKSANYLIKDQIAQAVQEFPTLKLTMFLTSCYLAH